MTLPIAIYTDGGLIGRNPSSLGGTWCYCWVDKINERINQDLGIILPVQYNQDITNNLTELYAAMKALESVPKGWTGTIYTDSKCTQSRITTGNRFSGIPMTIRIKVRELRANRKYKVVLLGGHPTRKELVTGFRSDGKLVSKWNVWCDDQCKKLARRFLREGK
jgi:ribonuclease HI